MSDTISIRRQDLQRAIEQIIAAFEGTNSESEHLAATVERIAKANVDLGNDNMDLREQVNRLKADLAEARMVAASHELVKQAAVTEAAELEQRLGGLQEALAKADAAITAALADQDEEGHPPYIDGHLEPLMHEAYDAIRSVRRQEAAPHE